MSRRVFLHGLPGGPRDMALMSANWHGADLIAGDTLAARLPEDMADVELVGFSLGAMAALTLAAQAPDRIKRLTLISPAAPLQLGDFLPRMAGRPVFEIAKRSASGLFALTALQGMITRVAAGALIRHMFAASCPQDRALLEGAASRDILHAGLRHALVDHPSEYCAALRSYVSDWTATLGQVTCPVTIWQGTLDSWTPPEMAQALAQSLPGSVDLRMIDGAGHYTALTRAEP